MYIYIYTCIYIYIYIYIYTHTLTYIHMYTHTHTNVYTHTHAQAHTYAHISYSFCSHIAQGAEFPQMHHPWMLTYIYKCIYIHMHNIYTNINIHTPPHSHAHACTHKSYVTSIPTSRRELKSQGYITLGCCHVYINVYLYVQLRVHANTNKFAHT